MTERTIFTESFNYKDIEMEILKIDRSYYLAEKGNYTEMVEVAWNLPFDNFKPDEDRFINDIKEAAGQIYSKDKQMLVLFDKTSHYTGYKLI